MKKKPSQKTKPKPKEKKRMALKTDYPPLPDPPKEPQPKDQAPKQHDTTSGKSYGTHEGVKDTEAEDKAEEVAFDKQKVKDDKASDEKK